MPRHNAFIVGATVEYVCGSTAIRGKIVAVDPEIRLSSRVAVPPCVVVREADGTEHTFTTQRDLDRLHVIRRK